MFLQGFISFSLDHSFNYPWLNVTSIVFDISKPTESCRKAGKRPLPLSKGFKGALVFLVHETLTQGGAAGEKTLLPEDTTAKKIHPCPT